MTTLTFLGATGTVTGSRFLLEIDSHRYLIDCGLFQGSKKNRLRNWDKFPVDPAIVEKVLITHAHIDHTGYLPRFCKQGFTGPIYATRGTYDLSEILLPDSAHLQEEDARHANTHGYSKHKPAEPLYTVEDAYNALSFFKPVYYGQRVQLLPDVRAKFRDAGHILGSAYIDIKRERGKDSRKIVFSGDLGRAAQPILKEPYQPFNVDYLILESTYGDRLHEDHFPANQLREVILRSIARGGVLLIPAFAVGRTQLLLYLIREMETRREIPSLPVYIDSPMAIDATAIFRKHMPELNMESRVLNLQGKKIFTPRKLTICRTPRESKAINKIKRRAIIISASGMATGGRILHHLEQRLPDPRNTILFVGYQAEGTRGRTILDRHDSVKIHGRHVPIRAAVESISGFSGHADYQEILAWLMGFNRPPKMTFIVHGEPAASRALAQKIRRRFGWKVVIPKTGETFTLDF